MTEEKTWGMKKMVRKMMLPYIELRDNRIASSKPKSTGTMIAAIIQEKLCESASQKRSSVKSFS